MASELSYSWCPECKKWIPSQYMNYFEGMKACNWCLNQEQENPPHNKFVYDPNYGKTQCIWCDSYETKRIGDKKYKCHECGEEFIL